MYVHTLTYINTGGSVGKPASLEQEDFVSDQDIARYVCGRRKQIDTQIDKKGRNTDRGLIES